MANARPLPPADINPWGKSIEVDVNSLLLRMDKAISDASNALQTANTALAGLSGIPAQFAVAARTTQSGITTETVIADISVPLTLSATTNLRFDGQLRHYGSTADIVVGITLKDNGSPIAQWTRIGNSSPTAAGTVNTSNFSAIVPAVMPGAHVYTLTITRAVGSGTVTVAPDPLGPSFLSVAAV